MVLSHIVFRGCHANSPSRPLNRAYWRCVYRPPLRHLHKRRAVGCGAGSGVWEMSDWLDISTAPNDGTVVRVRQGDFAPVHALQKNGRWTFIEYDHPLTQNLTHWRLDEKEPTPPLDNEHVADGCEQFDTTPPMETPRG